MAPTKHNVLCQGKSVYEIIFGHEDLSSRTATLVKRSEESEFEDLDPETKTEGPQVLESIAESDFPGLEFVNIMFFKISWSFYLNQIIFSC